MQYLVISILVITVNHLVISILVISDSHILKPGQNRQWKKLHIQQLCHPLTMTSES